METEPSTAVPFAEPGSLESRIATLEKQMALLLQGMEAMAEKFLDKPIDLWADTEGTDAGS